jgi:hypothetical protein
VVAATGPSLTRSDLDAVRAAGIPLLVVNDAWRLAPWADDLYACDYRWWKVHEQASRAFQGTRWTQDQKAAREWKSLRFIPSAPRLGLGTDPAGPIHQGQNSGYQAVNLAYLLGARTVILLGYDMSHDNGRAHFFGSHSQNGLIDAPDYRPYAKAFEHMAPGQYGLTVINCSRRSALECFPRERLEDVLLRYQAAAALPA